METLLGLITSTECLVFVVIAIFTTVVWRALRKGANLPPGPRGLPLVGYLPFLSGKPNEDFFQLSQKYGKIFSIKLGTKFAVVLGDYDSIKEALVKQADNFSARILQPFTVKREPTIFSAEEEVFKDYKRFTLTTLRDFGVGKLSMEPRINEEIGFLIKTIESKKGEATDIGDLIRMSVSNVICAVMLGHRFDYDNQRFQELISVLNEHMTRIVPFTWELVMPWLFVVPGVAKLFGHKSVQETHDHLMNIIRRKVGERAATHKEGDEHDFIDIWMTEEKQRGEGNADNFTNEHLVKVLFSLFLAGSDTTSNTIRWSLLYLMKHPEIQEKIHKEIDEVVGYERSPSVQDRSQMPYTEATLNEVQRIATLVPLAILHSNFHETTLCGYHIPKRSVIVPNLWAVHHDPTIYPEPSEFKPERFLDAEGKLTKAEKLIPFSQGKRQCLGESLAKAELFLYFAALLQRFTFKKPKEDELCFDYTFSTVSVPDSHKLHAIVRNQKRS